jgi:hypothetical protein
MTCLEAINFVKANELALATQKATYLASFLTNGTFPTGTTGENIGLSAYCNCDQFTRGDRYYSCGVDAVGICPPCGCCEEAVAPIT